VLREDGDQVDVSATAALPGRPDALCGLVQDLAGRDLDLSRVADALADARGMVRALARAREQAGLTQAEVAKRVGTTQSAIARLERAEALPNLSTLVKYATVVGRRIALV
jgi:DNA-binding XRE family transcriptional regulator